jgi:hypothetical protein
MQCPTISCGVKRPTHSKRIYCDNCRASMGRLAKLPHHEVVKRVNAAERRLYRVNNFRKRKADQLQARSR